jgi:hypothetical protein
MKSAASTGAACKKPQCDSALVDVKELQEKPGKAFGCQSGEITNPAAKKFT